MRTPWLFLALCFYVLSNALAAWASNLSLNGSTKFSSRVYMGICGVFLPMAFYILAINSMQSIGTQAKWVFYTFISSGILVHIRTFTLCLVFVIRHGAKTGLHPFEQQNDLGTDFANVHSSIMFGSMLMIFLAFNAIYAGPLDCFHVKDVMLPAKKIL